MEVGIVEPADDLLDEVLGGAVAFPSGDGLCSASAAFVVQLSDQLRKGREGEPAVTVEKRLFGAGV